MKLVIILSVLCAFAFFSTGIAMAEELSELKEQLAGLQGTVDALSSKIKALESKQESQDKEIKKVPEIAKTVDELKESPQQGALEGATIGGHLKFFLADQSYGKRNGDTQHNNMSAGMGSHALYLLLGKEITDALKLDVGLDIRVTASATPSLGSSIDRATTGSVDTTKLIYKAHMTYLLPQGAELKAGLFNPMFSEEYAKETWWHELYHQNMGLCNLQSWHDTGIELYKNYDFDKWSLPVYLTILNGASTQYTDNNGAKTLLVHIAPELFRTKLRLLGSLAYGKYGSTSEADTLRYVVGFDWNYQKFGLTGELISSKYEDVLTTGSIYKDGENKGAWIRALYHFTPELAGLIKFSHVELYLTGTSTMRTNSYNTTAFALDYNVTPSSTIILEYQIVDADRSDESEKLDYNRYTLGWRTTF